MQTYALLIDVCDGVMLGGGGGVAVVVGLQKWGCSVRAAVVGCCGAFALEAGGGSQVQQTVDLLIAIRLAGNHDDLCTSWCAYDGGAFVSDTDHAMP